MIVNRNQQTPVVAKEEKKIEFHLVEDVATVWESKNQSLHILYGHWGDNGQDRFDVRFINVKDGVEKYGKGVGLNQEQLIALYDTLGKIIQD